MSCVFNPIKTRIQDINELIKNLELLLSEMTHIEENTKTAKTSIVV